MDVTVLFPDAQPGTQGPDLLLGPRRSRGWVEEDPVSKVALTGVLLN